MVRQGGYNTRQSQGQKELGFFVSKYACVYSVRGKTLSLIHFFHEADSGHHSLLARANHSRKACDRQTHRWNGHSTTVGNNFYQGRAIYFHVHTLLFIWSQTHMHLRSQVFAHTRSLRRKTKTLNYRWPLSQWCETRLEKRKAAVEFLSTKPSTWKALRIGRITQSSHEHLVIAMSSPACPGFESASRIGLGWHPMSCEHWRRAFAIVICNTSAGDDNAVFC